MWFKDLQMPIQDIITTVIYIAEKEQMALVSQKMKKGFLTQTVIPQLSIPIEISQQIVGFPLSN